MSAILSMLASFLGVLLKELLPTLLDEFRKPRGTKFVGTDHELDAAIDASIREDAEREVDDGA